MDDGRDPDNVRRQNTDARPKACKEVGKGNQRQRAKQD